MIVCSPLTSPLVKQLIVPSMVFPPNHANYAELVELQKADAAIDRAVERLCALQPLFADSYRAQGFKTHREIFEKIEALL